MMPLPEDAVAHVMTVSRVVWEHVVAPIVSNRGGEPLSQAQCVWVLGVADALFPLVPRACRAVLAAQCASARARARARGLDEEQQHACKYLRCFVLECAAIVGSERCIRWMVLPSAQHTTTTTRNNKKECIAVLKGLCYGGHMRMAQELVDSTGQWTGILEWPGKDPGLADDLKDARGGKTSLLSCAINGGHSDAVQWVVSQFGGVAKWCW
ncbi:hypothetical protein Pelo_3046 [Pelomyxa schiedti]|nr:hypothetical protein Pelo_3046 [Pelomyxa schiedti]